MSNLLLVEDDKMLGQVMHDALVEAELTVTWVKTGEEALLRVKEMIPNLVYLDIMLPGIDGYEVLKQIKAGPQTAGVRVVMLSNLGQAEEMEKAKGMGAEDFLVKANIDLQNLVELTKTRLAGAA